MDQRKDTQGTREDGMDVEEMTQARSYAAKVEPSQSGGAIDESQQADEDRGDTGTQSDNAGRQNANDEPGQTCSR